MPKTGKQKKSDDGAAPASVSQVPPNDDDIPFDEAVEQHEGPDYSE